MDKKKNIFTDNEIQANSYTANGLLIAAGVAVLMWLLNVLGFFIVDGAVMNVGMPIGIVFLLIPVVLVKGFKIEKSWLKYIIVLCFLFGLGVMATALTAQLVLAWACPIIMVCHFYSPKLANFTFVGVLVFMLISVFLGLYVGVWDSNMMHSNESLSGFYLRVEFIEEALVQGDDILLRVFNFYYIPRAAICGVIYLISLSLAKRTHRLLKQQEKDYLEKERISLELSVATEIQSSMLPNIFPAFPEKEEFDIFATMTPSKEVGGDFYDFFLVDEDHLAMVIADVSGKGVPAAMFMMVVKTLIKNNVSSEKSPSQVLFNVNNQLCENAETDMFVTVWLGIYEISTGKLTATNAGHEYPVVKNKNKKFEILKDRHGFVIGGMENSKFTDYEIFLEPDDIVFVYTDGVAEAVNINNDAYGMDKLIEVLNKKETDDLKEVLHSVKQDVDNFAGQAPQFDDITMLAIKRKN